MPSADVQSGFVAGVPGVQPWVPQPQGPGGARTMHCQGGTPCANGQLDPTACSTAGLLFQTQATAAGVGRSLCFDRDSQIKAFVVRRQVMAKGNYTHLSAPPVIATN